MTSGERVLYLEGVHNFRDFGGYRVAGGGALRRGMLWRSGQHSGATDNDLAAISGLGLASVFDLRTLKERTVHPCRRPVGFSAEVFHAPVPSRHSAPHVEAAQMTRQRTPEATREKLRGHYAKMPFRPELQTMMQKWFAVLAEGRGPSLVNCMAGKDRTGIAVAMVLLALGVHRDDVFEDYLLTRTAGDSQARIAAGSQTVREIVGEIDDAVLQVIMGVEPDYLETAIAAAEERHGSLDAYLAEALGADAALRDRIGAVLVEG